MAAYAPPTMISRTPTSPPLLQRRFAALARRAVPWMFLGAVACGTLAESGGHSGATTTGAGAGGAAAGGAGGAAAGGAGGAAGGGSPVSDAGADAPIHEDAHDAAMDAEAGDGGSACATEYADGHFPAGTVTFTLPPSAISSKHEIYLPDVQAAFPGVDWTAMDRLYIPAGHYSLLRLGNLPDRSALRPLVITNSGGQVRIGGFPSSYLVSITGGSHWVFTGRYDPTSGTGDAAFPGHRCAAYATSRGRYGIVVDDDWHEFPAQQRIGLGIGGSAHDFEVEFLEATGVGFAGVVAKNHDVALPIMHHMAFHDLYIHDVGSEGFYLGDTDLTTAVPYDHVAIYNNRVLRTGSEPLQVGQLGDGSEVHHNVFALGGRMWRSAFECGVQDGNTQYGQRNGVASVHHNTFLGATQSLLQAFQPVAPGDPHAVGDGVTFSDNYFASTRWLGVYLHVPAAPVAFSTTFEHNYFRDLAFTYDELYPNLAERAYIFGGSSTPNEPVILHANVWDGPWKLHAWGGTFVAPDGAFGSVTVSGSQHAPLAPMRFVDFGLPADTDYRRVEFWVPQNLCYDQWGTGTSDPAAPPPTYLNGTIVMYQRALYRLDAATSTGEPPDLFPAKWSALGLPADDVRQADASPYPGVGLAY